ncbi:hypothetical protein XENTR_v10003272 [Xenopus tropicalis]|uniref:LOC100145065 n=3 Tax=Xenopus tropicalis TaxID=8364 RepID=A0A803JJT0_XENTR|nr:uncharacterized protein LOC100145065 [Xenopus tropicalis]XP_031750888.1 uncharacterized protein LOC100145065 [Xenopus tropicalis]XP_031750890.1 uncharacterized protein LOC100145065 [Xenopus tropicalis]KAE8637019.1 hypothetical protein XENTR_v10003272 [Xenopus tropicalis]
MDQELTDGSVGRAWTPQETQAMLDLIRDLGLGPALTRKGYQNWDVFERLQVLLSHCRVRASSAEIKAQWQALKMKFWRLKRFVGLAPLVAITADFPFYQQMEQLLEPQKRMEICSREADSTIQESGRPTSSLSDSPSDEDMTDDASIPEVHHEQEPAINNGGNLHPENVQEAAPQDGAAIRNPHLAPEALADLEPEPIRLLQTTMGQLVEGMAQLVQTLNRVCGVQEQISIQLGYFCSLLPKFPIQMGSGRPRNQEGGKCPEKKPVVHGPRNSRGLRRSLRIKKFAARYSS